MLFETIILTSILTKDGDNQSKTRRAIPELRREPLAASRKGKCRETWNLFLVWRWLDILITWVLEIIGRKEQIPTSCLRNQKHACALFKRQKMSLRGRFEVTWPMIHPFFLHYISTSDIQYRQEVEHVFREKQIDWGSRLTWSV